MQTGARTTNIQPPPAAYTYTIAHNNIAHNNIAVGIRKKTITVILDLCLKKSGSGKSRDFTLKMTCRKSCLMFSFFKTILNNF